MASLGFFIASFDFEFGFDFGFGLLEVVLAFALKCFGLVLGFVIWLFWLL